MNKERKDKLEGHWEVVTRALNYGRNTECGKGTGRYLRGTLSTKTQSALATN